MSNKPSQSIINYVNRTRGVEPGTLPTDPDDIFATELCEYVERGYQLLLDHIEHKEGDAVIEAIHQLTSFMDEEQTFSYKCKLVTDTLVQIYE